MVVLILLLDDRFEDLHISIVLDIVAAHHSYAESDLMADVGVFVYLVFSTVFDLLQLGNAMVVGQVPYLLSVKGTVHFFITQLLL